MPDKSYPRPKEKHVPYPLTLEHNTTSFFGKREWHHWLHHHHRTLNLRITPQLLMALAEEEEEYERTILILSSSLVQVSLMIPFHSSMQPTTLYE